MNLQDCADQVFQICRRPPIVNPTTGVVTERPFDKDVVKQACRDYGIELLEIEQWAFLKSEGTETTVANQTQYTLLGTGSPGDCAQVGGETIIINGLEYTFKSFAEFHRLKNTVTPGVLSGWRIWTVVGSNGDGNPTIEILDPVATAGLAIEFVYVKIVPDDPFLILPRGLQMHVRDEMCFHFVPDTTQKSMYAKRAEKAMAAARKRWAPIQTKVTRNAITDENAREVMALNRTRMDSPFSGDDVFYIDA